MKDTCPVYTLNGCVSAGLTTLKMVLAPGHPPKEAPIKLILIHLISRLEYAFTSLEPEQIGSSAQYGMGYHSLD